MRVLITTVTAGAGHLAAAAAMEEAWRACRPGDTVQQVDLVKFFSPLHRKIVSDGYVTLVEHAPELWGMMFAKTDSPKLAKIMNRWKRLIPSQSRGKFIRYVKGFEPDVVLCTHYLPLEILGILRTDEKKKREAESRKRGKKPAGGGGWVDPFVVSIVTDFEAHALWMDSCADLYCVAAEETKARLVARGAEAGRVLASGIPISGRFAKAVDADAVRRRYGLRDDLPVVLVLSGGFGMGPVEKILQELDKVEHELQALVVTGKNQTLRREIAAQDRRHPTHVIGFSTNMHELMAVADLLITKPGGLTSSEALAIGKPLMIVNPIPGQEAANSDFLLEHGAAAKVNRVEDLPYRIDQLFGSKKLSELAKAAAGLGRPEAAMEICEEVVRRAEAR